MFELLDVFQDPDQYRVTISGGELLIAPVADDTDVEEDAVTASADTDQP